MDLIESSSLILASAVNAKPQVSSMLPTGKVPLATNGPSFQELFAQRGSWLGPCGTWLAGLAMPGQPALKLATRGKAAPLAGAANNGGPLLIAANTRGEPFSSSLV